MRKRDIFFARALTESYVPSLLVIIHTIETLRTGPVPLRDER